MPTLIVRWTSPVKVRQSALGGDKKMIIYNDLEATEKIKILPDTGFNHRTDEEKQAVLVDYRTGDIFIPKLSEQEALFGVAKSYYQFNYKQKIPVVKCSGWLRGRSNFRSGSKNQ